eukprot:TRINITY_DN18311_c0_g1_i1.p1 TRINITY_DN18311_c0_g1~~TRINITY_DN18311_c0_g1_i1.p1  ORF type:complete len:327 (+),score=46.17 TRINITY_DN18311_c0_g1_i1:66-983(+)
MGRRHFHFGPQPRAMQSSVQQGTCQVAPDDRPLEARAKASLPLQPQDFVDHIPARRLFPGRQAPSRGPAVGETPQKRHYRQPSVDSAWSSSVRRGGADYQQQESAEDSNAPSGRRHLRGYPGQLAQNGISCSEGRCVSGGGGRRHVEPPVPQRANSLTRATGLGEQLPKQRRHVREEDHLQGGGVCPGRPCPEPRPEALRCSDASPTYCDQGISQALTQADYPKTTPAEPLLLLGGDGYGAARCRTPQRRRLDLHDHLVGGTLRGSAGDAAAPLPRHSRTSQCRSCVRGSPLTTTERRIVCPLLN